MALNESALRRPDAPPSHLRRRELLVALAAGTLTVASGGVITVAPASAATPAGPVTLDEFMELSDILTDREFSLDDEPGAVYLASLVADPAFDAPLRQLVQDTARAQKMPSTFDEVVRSGALRSDAAARTAQQILVLWYSGLVNDRTADYLEALAWETLSFPKPPSTPVGFSKWDEAP